MQLKHVSAKDGFLWFRQGFAIFRRNPLIFITLMFAYYFSAWVLSLVPLIGIFLFLILIPGLNVAFFTASRDVLLNKPVFPTLLATGFRELGPVVTKRLLVLGLIYFAGIALALGLTALLNGGAITPLNALDGAASGTDAASAASDGPSFALLLSPLLTIPVAVLFWFAPIMVAWHDTPPLKALFFSWVVCWRNKWAFLIYAGLWIAFALAIVMTLAIILQLAGAGGALIQLLLPTTVMATSVMYASYYATYRGCFLIEGPPLPEPGDTPATRNK